MSGWGHAGCRCIFCPFCCNLIDVSMQTYLGLGWPTHPCLIDFECGWFCSEGKIVSLSVQGFAAGCSWGNTGKTFHSWKRRLAFIWRQIFQQDWKVFCGQIRRHLLTRPFAINTKTKMSLKYSGIHKILSSMCYSLLREQFKSRDLDIWHLQETAIASLDSNPGLFLGLQN